MKKKNKNKWQEWWKNFFDEALIGSFVPSKVGEEIKILKKFLDQDKIILDIGCGIGRFSLALAELGYNVYALDFNEFYLKILEKEVRKRGLQEKIKILHLDMKKLGLLKKDFFDCALFIFNTFGYFTHKENIKILKDISTILKPKGKLIIQQSNFNFVYSKLKRRDWFKTDKCWFLAENKWRKLKDRIIIYTTWTIVHKEREKVLKKFQRFNLYTPSSLIQMCEKNRFKLNSRKKIKNMDWFCFSLIKKQ